MMGFFLTLLFYIMLVGYLFQFVGVIIALQYGDYKNKVHFFLSLIPFLPLFAAFWKIGK